jgi:membrane protease YdiL (CAAX protease family)
MASPDVTPSVPAAVDFVDDEHAASKLDRTSAFRRVPWRMSDIVIGLGVLLPWRLVVSFDRQWLISLPVWVYWTIYIVPSLVWTLVFPIWIARRRSSAPLFVIPGLSDCFKETAAAIAAWVAIFVSVTVVITVEFLIIGKAAIPPDVLEGIGGSGNLASSIAFLVLAVTLGPISEELFFRAFLYNALRLRMPSVVALILQALVFGAMHAYGIAHSIFAFLLGVGLALVYDWRKTLLTPILVHCIQDSIAALRAAIVLLAALNAPHLGINGTPVERGVLIATVQPGTTAEEIGLRKGDIIAKFDGQTLHEIGELARLVRGKHIGDQVTIEVIRDGRPVAMNATLGHTLGK